MFVSCEKSKNPNSVLLAIATVSPLDCITLVLQFHLLPESFAHTVITQIHGQEGHVTTIQLHVYSHGLIRMTQASQCNHVLEPKLHCPFVHVVAGKIMSSNCCCVTLQIMTIICAKRMIKDDSGQKLLSRAKLTAIIRCVHLPMTIIVLAAVLAQQ